MKVSVNPELEAFISEQVRTGRYSSADEVVEAGLARLMVDPPTEELDPEDLLAIERSEQQIARGEDLDWQEVAARLRQKYLKK